MTAAIIVEKLGKRYQIQHEARADTLRDAMHHGVRGLWRKLRARSTTTEGFWAINDLSFEVPAGDVLGIIGRNGAGKSTLLKMLSRITEPTTGRLRLRGRVASLLEVGTGFHPELSGRENIFLNGAILGMSRTEILRKFDEIVAFAEVERFLDTPVKRYSSGMYVRLAFAVAAHLEPEILIVDEVLAVGDAVFQQKCLGRMGQVASSGRTVLFVSHNLGAVQSLCTSGLYLKEGKLVAQGPVAQVAARYFQSGSIAEATRWERPPPYPLEAFVKRLSVSGRGELTRGERLEIVVELDGPIPKGLVTGLQVSNRHEVVVHHSSDEFHHDFPDPRRRTIQIDTTHMNVGTYKVDIVLSVRNQRFVDRAEGHVGFKLTDPTLFVAGTIAEDWTGVFAPRAVTWS